MPIGKGIWGRLMKGRESTKTAGYTMDDALRILEGAAGDNPEVKGALRFIIGELKTGRLSPEAALRSGSMAERAARTQTGVPDITSTKILGDYGTSRKAAKDVMSGNEWDVLEERIRDFDLKGNTKSKRAGENDDIDRIADDMTELGNGPEAVHHASHALEDEKLNRWDNLDPDARDRYLGKLYENPPIEHYRNAIKSGMSQQDAIESTRRYIELTDDTGVDFKDVAEYLRSNGVID